jgi:hypothetical protein
MLHWLQQVAEAVQEVQVLALLLGVAHTLQVDRQKVAMVPMAVDAEIATAVEVAVAVVDGKVVLAVRPIDLQEVNVEDSVDHQVQTLCGTQSRQQQIPLFHQVVQAQQHMY